MNPADFKLIDHMINRLDELEGEVTRLHERIRDLERDYDRRLNAVTTRREES